ncbi:hypothetical protein BDV09DRAFT_71070 [Aspergillus tetrazonus]
MRIIHTQQRIITLHGILRMFRSVLLLGRMPPRREVERTVLHPRFDNRDTSDILVGLKSHQETSPRLPFSCGDLHRANFTRVPIDFISGSSKMAKQRKADASGKFRQRKETIEELKKELAKERETSRALREELEEERKKGIYRSEGDYYRGQASQPAKSDRPRPPRVTLQHILC